MQFGVVPRSRSLTVILAALKLWESKEGFQGVGCTVSFNLVSMRHAVVYASGPKPFKPSKREVNKAVAVFDTDFWTAGCGTDLMLAINQRGANIDNRGMFPALVLVFVLAILPVRPTSTSWQFLCYSESLGLRFPYFMNLNRDWRGSKALLGFAVGRYAVASEQKTDAEVEADFMSRLRQQFPNAPNPTHFLRTKWGSDPFAHGSYTTPSGVNAKLDELGLLSQAVSASLSLAGLRVAYAFALSSTL